MSTFNGSIKHTRNSHVGNAPASNKVKSAENKSLRDQGPWPEPTFIEPSILGTINSIQSHMRRGVPIS